MEIESPSTNKRTEEGKEESTNKGKEVQKKDTKWKKGVSGNPNGRPKGTKNRTTELQLLIQEKLLNDLEEEAKEILYIALQKAKSGDRVLLKFFLERFLPAASVNLQGGDPTNNQLQIIISPMEPTNVSAKPITPTQGEVIDAEVLPQEDEGDN